MALLGAQFVNAVSPNPVGSLQAYAGASAPTGWLLCDGGQTLITAYPELYSVIGTTYGALTNGSGGAGSTHFLVPDLRGRMPIGAGNENVTGNNTARTRGVKGGDTRLQSHTHTGTTNTGSADIAIDSGGLRWGQQPNASGNGWAVDASTYTGGVLRPVYDRGHTHGFTTGEHNQSVGSGANMPPFLVTNYIIKAIPDAPRSGLAYGSTPPIVTALPSNPQFGDVVIYIADATNGVAWNLQYDATGTYPWKFIGGSPLTAQVDTDENIVAGTITYTALATAGPSITLALAGDYVISQGLRGYPFAVNQSLHMSYDIGATSASDNDSVLLDCASGFGENGSRTRLKTGIAANTAIVSKYKHTSTGAGANFAYRWMTITPVRVSA